MKLVVTSRSARRLEIDEFNTNYLVFELDGVKLAFQVIYPPSLANGLYVACLTQQFLEIECLESHLARIRVVAKRPLSKPPLDDLPG